MSILSHRGDVDFRLEEAASYLLMEEAELANASSTLFRISSNFSWG